MKMEPIVSSETSAIRTQTPGNHPKRNKLHLEHGESLRTRLVYNVSYAAVPNMISNIYFACILKLKLCTLQTHSEHDSEQKSHLCCYGLNSNTRSFAGHLWTNLRELVLDALHVVYFVTDRSTAYRD